MTRAIFQYGRSQTLWRVVIFSTLDIPATDRREFEKLFGRHTDYNAEDITRITYGRNTIYEAPTAQTEDLEEHWQSEAAAPQQAAPKMDSMSL